MLSAYQEKDEKEEKEDRKRRRAWMRPYLTRCANKGHYKNQMRELANARVTQSGFLLEKSCKSIVIKFFKF